MANRYHDLEVEGSVHIPNDLTYANQAARLAASGLAAKHVGRLAKQTDDNSYWVLTSISPVTWAPFTAPAPSIGDAGKVLTVEDDGVGNPRTAWETTAASGEVNTASNAGAGGVGVFDNKNGVDLEMRNIRSTTNRIGVALDAPNKEIEVTLNEGNIPHQDLFGAGTNDHAAIDSHIADTANPHATDLGNLGSGTLAELNAVVTDATLDDSGDPRDPNAHAASHESGGTDTIRHQNLVDAGTNSHAQIDSHISDGTIHFAEGDIDHTAIQNIGTNSHAAIDAHIAGSITAPASSTDGTPAIWDGTSGQVLKDSPATSVPLDTAGGGADTEGVLSWDADAKTLRIPTNIPGVVNQAGQEFHDQAWNDTGAQLNDFTPVYATGTISNELPDVDLSDAAASGASVDARAVLGLMTHDAADSTQCIVTPRGVLNDVDTSAWAEGTELWLAEGGGKTDTKPLLPSSQIRLGIVLKQNATTGKFKVNVEDLSLSGVGIAQNQAKERCGFVLEDEVAVDSAGNPLVLSADAVTRTFTITPTSGTFFFFSLNNLFPKVGPQSVTWTDVEGDHIFYYDSLGVLKHTTSVSNSYILGPDAIAGYLRWDATNKEVILDQPVIELHGLQMDGATHLANHRNVGARVVSGLSLGSLITNGDGSLDAHAQFSVESGAMTDEDLRHDIATVPSTTGTRILYLEGAGALQRQYTNAGFSVMTDIDAGIGATGRLVFNEFIGGAWQFTTVGVNNYVLCHTFTIGTDPAGKQVYSYLGQAEYSTLTDAQAGALTEIENIVSAVPFAEKRAISTTIFQTGGYGNAVNARIRPAADGDYVDQRGTTATGASGFTTTDHNGLSGRSVAGAHPALAVAPDTTNFDGVLSGTDTDAQTALETIDDHGPEDHKNVIGTPVKNDVQMYDGSDWQLVPEGTVFTFSIATFTDNIAGSIHEIGTGTWQAIGAASFSATYNNGPPDATPSIQLSGQFAAWVAALDMTTSPDFEGPTANTEAIAYPAAPSSSVARVRLSAQVGAETDTQDINFYFYNRRFWDVSSTATGITEGEIEAFAGNELSNSRAKTFTVNAAVGEYIWYSYPTRLGTATFKVGGFEGGFESPETVSITNASGYTENYYAYRSTNSGLGSTTVEVS